MHVVTRVEKKFLKVLVACPHATRAQLALAMNVSTVRVSQLVVALRARGLIEGAAYGELAVTVDPTQCIKANKPRGWQVRKRMQSVSKPFGDSA